MYELPVFVQRFRELCDGLTQKQVSEKTGLKPSTVSNYLAGSRSNPAAEELSKIAKGFNVTADWLIGLSKFRTPEKKIWDASTVTGLSENAIEYLRDEPNHELRTEIFNILLSPDFDRILVRIADYLYEAQNAGKRRKASKERLAAEHAAAQPGADFIVLNHDDMATWYEGEAVKEFSRFLDLAVPAIVRKEAADHAINTKKDNKSRP